MHAHQFWWAWLFWFRRYCYFQKWPNFPFRPWTTYTCTCVLVPPQLNLTFPSFLPFSLSIRLRSSTVEEQVFQILKKWKAQTYHPSVSLLEDSLRTEGFMISVPHIESNNSFNTASGGGKQLIIIW